MAGFGLISGSLGNDDSVGVRGSEFDVNAVFIARSTSQSWLDRY